MEVKASAKYLRISPRKLRLLAKGLRGLSPQKALLKLEFYPQRGSEFLQKTIKQAMANATANFKQAEDSLKIKKIEIGEGPSFKRIDKSHGSRFDRGMIKKKTAHLFLTLESNTSESEQLSKKENSVIKEEKGGKTRPPSPRLRRVNGTKS